MHHSSIEKIKENYNGMSGFNFKCVTSDYILCLLNKLNARKATGFDNIPPKLLRLGSDIICTHLQSLLTLPLQPLASQIC